MLPPSIGKVRATQSLDSQRRSLVTYLRERYFFHRRQDLPVALPVLVSNSQILRFGAG